MNNNNNNDKMQRPSRPNRQSRRSHHKRNPSIRTLMKSKRYQQATPKMNMEQVFFSPHGDDIQDFELEAKMAPKIERLESGQ